MASLRSRHQPPREALTRGPGLAALLQSLLQREHDDYNMQAPGSERQGRSLCLRGGGDRIFSPLVLGSTELLTYPALVVDKMLKALKFHSSEARLKFPRLLQIIAQYPEETLGLMTREVSVFLPAAGA